MMPFPPIAGLLDTSPSVVRIHRGVNARAPMHGLRPVLARFPRNLGQGDSAPRPGRSSMATSVLAPAAISTVTDCCTSSSPVASRAVTVTVRPVPGGASRVTVVSDGTTRGRVTVAVTGKVMPRPLTLTVTECVRTGMTRAVTSAPPAARSRRSA